MAMVARMAEVNARVCKKSDIYAAKERLPTHIAENHGVVVPSCTPLVNEPSVHARTKRDCRDTTQNPGNTEVRFSLRIVFQDHVSSYIEFKCALITQELANGVSKSSKSKTDD